MGLLSLPREILGSIVQSVTLAHLGPERRLHPCSNSRYLSKGHQRREHPCPALLLCCRGLHHIGKEIFYQNVTIVLGLDYHSQPYYSRCYPTPEKEKSTLSVLASRTSLLPYIKHLELMISRTTSWGAFVGDQPQTSSWGSVVSRGFHFRPNESDPALSIATITGKMPNLETISWTVGMGDVADSSLSEWEHLPKAEQLARTLHDATVLQKRPKIPDHSLLYPLSTILQYQPCGVETTRFRMWLTHIHLEILMSCANNRIPPDLDLPVDPDAVAISELSSHCFLKAIIQLPSLKHLDVFLPYVPDLWLFDEGYIGEDLDCLKRLLSIVFSHVDEVRFWQAGSDNVTSGDYEGADTRSPAVQNDYVGAPNWQIGGGGTFEAREGYYWL